MEKIKVSKEDFELVQLIKERKLDKDDFSFLFTLKDGGYTEKDIKDLKRLRDIKHEDKQRNRLETIEQNNRKIKYAEREIEHRQSQIDKRISLEKHENYIDGKKPLFVLQSDIDETYNQIDQLKEVNKYAQKEYDDNQD